MSSEADTRSERRAPLSAQAELELYGAQLAAGAQIGSYVVEDFLSQGGFASVYRVHHHETKAEGALKLLHRALAASSVMVKRFKQEIEVIRRLRHPGLVQIYDYGEMHDRRPYYVMERIDGVDLAHYLDRNGLLPIDVALGVFDQLGGALDLAHRAGVIHRDLKASNVLVAGGAPPLSVKLIDFGVAKLIDADDVRQKLSSTGLRIGTPENMAPEQILGQPVDARTDIYAFGVLMFHALTGRLPFRAPTDVEVQRLHLEVTPPRVTDFVHVPARVATVIQRCLAKEMGQRYVRMHDVLDELRGSATNLEPQTERDAAGLYLQVLSADPTAFDEVVDQLDDLRQRLEDRGLSIALHTATSLLAVRLVGDHETAQQVRAAVMELALELVEMDDAQLPTRVSLHFAPVLLNASAELTGGALLQLASWVPEPLDCPLVATPEAVSGIEANMALVTTAHGDSHLQITRR